VSHATFAHHTENLESILEHLSGLEGRRRRLDVLEELCWEQRGFQVTRGQIIGLKEAVNLRPELLIAIGGGVDKSTPLTGRQLQRCLKNRIDSFPAISIHLALSDQFSAIYAGIVSS
jgi:hypothetical protein